MTIDWDPKALAALVEAVEGLSLFSEPAAGRLLQNVMAAVDRLEVFPEMGRVVPEFDVPQIREVFVGRYRLLYRLGADGTQILTLWSTALPLEPR